MEEKKYNFEHNIVELSKGKTFNECKTEWVKVKTVNLKQKERCRCICNHILTATGTYFYNLETKKCIMIGCACIKKFGVGLNKLVKQKLLLSIIDKQDFNEYQEIIDLFEYSEEIRRLIENEIYHLMALSNDLIFLKHLLDDIFELKQDEKFYIVIQNLKKKIEEQQQLQEQLKLKEHQKRMEQQQKLLKLKEERRKLQEQQKIMEEQRKLEEQLKIMEERKLQKQQETLRVKNEYLQRIAEKLDRKEKEQQRLIDEQRIKEEIQLQQEQIKQKKIIEEIKKK